MGGESPLHPSTRCWSRFYTSVTRHPVHPRISVEPGSHPSSSLTPWGPRTSSTSLPLRELVNAPLSLPPLSSVQPPIFLAEDISQLTVGAAPVTLPTGKADHDPRHQDPHNPPMASLGSSHGPRAGLPGLELASF